MLSKDFSKNPQIKNLMKNRLLGAELFNTDGQTFWSYEKSLFAILRTRLRKVGNCHDSSVYCLVLILLPFSTTGSLALNYKTRQQCHHPYSWWYVFANYQVQNKIPKYLGYGDQNWKMKKTGHFTVTVRNASNVYCLPKIIFKTDITSMKLRFIPNY